jgi:hypothetical protein
VLAVLTGVALGLLSILKFVDAGFFLALARPFHPVTDGSLFGPAVEFLTVSIGRLGALAAVVATVVLVVAVLVVMTFSVIRVSRLVVEHRSTAARAVAVLAPIWLVCALLGVHIVPGVPLAAGSTASFAYDTARQVRADIHDRAAFAGTLGVDTFRDTPDGELLTALRGKDVVLAFVESYGRWAIEDPELGPRAAAVLDDGTRRLNAAGFGSRSAFLTSSTAGGGSWLAHATLLSGLWIDNQQRYSDLTASRRLTLTGAFRRAGWRTVGIMPGITSAWPEGSFYGYDQIYDAAHLGYHGPRFSFATMPDQYTLSTFQRLERAAPHHAPLMAVIPLLSSHAPWFPLPRPVAWGEVGDGSVFNSMAAPGDRPDAILTRDPARVRADYEQSIEYSLSTLIDYLQTDGDDNLVFIFLGDHQPSPIVTGPDASRDVPITIVTRDRTVLDRIAPWGWQDGLRPTPAAPTWRMDGFRDRFLTAFGSRIQPTGPRAAPSGW